MKQNCLNPENYLKQGMYSDIDRIDLFYELKILKEIITTAIKTPLTILNYIQKVNYFPNACITYKILLIIPFVSFGALVQSYVYVVIRFIN